MTLAPQVVHRYFAAPDRGFWRWLDDDPTAGWCDQGTIAFGAELYAVLARLAPRGLPPLDAVMLVLAACRDNWSQEPPRAKSLHSILANQNLSSFQGHLSTVLKGLDQVHACRRHVFSPAAKAELAAMIFEGLPSRRSAETGQALLAAFRHGEVEEEQAWGAADTRHALRQAIGCLLGSRLGAFSEEALARRLKTGLEELPAPAEIETPPAGTARELLVQLQDDEELGGVARLAKLLLAVVQLPRAVSDPDELPLGGVSDITNRGSLDRLLLSELAHDDLTLAVRVALNEALYLRREAPPHVPPRERLVLLDSGLRLWGVPRVFATAVGLALAAASEKDLRVTAYRASGSELEEVDFSTPAGLERHLAALDHRLHPGEALERFVELGKQRHGAGDLVLVTAEDTAADPRFREALARVDLGPWYLVTVARGGQFRMEHRGPRGSKLLREATLALDDVLKPRPRSAALLDAAKAEELPALCRMQPFPLRLSASVDASRSWHVHGLGVLTLTNDRRLLFWEDPARGARQLVEGLPQGRLHWAASTLDADGFATAVIGKLSRQGLHMLRVNPSTGVYSVRPLEIQNDRPLAIAGRGGVIFVMFMAQVEALDPVTGKMLAASDLHGWTGVYNREYAIPPGRSNAVNQWRTLMYDGQELGTVAVGWGRESPLLQRQSAILFQPIFDRVGSEGPVAMTGEGNVYNSTEGRTDIKHGLQPPVLVQAVSRDGQRVALTSQGPGTSAIPNPTVARPLVLADTLSGETRKVHDTPANAVESNLPQYARPRALRSRFHGIALDQQRRMTLVTRKGAGWTLDYSPRFAAIVLSPGGRLPAEDRTPELERIMVRRTRFTNMAVTQEHGYSLHVWKWQDGSRAVLDSRGLLHLKSSNSKLPEFSVVLVEGNTAGWSADGRWWGPEYFIHPHPATPTSDIYEQLFVPFLARLS